MYIGSVGYIVSLTMVSLAFLLDWEGEFVPIFLFLFIAAHAIGQGTVIWVFIAEIFPPIYEQKDSLWMFYPLGVSRSDYLIYASCFS